MTRRSLQSVTAVLGMCFGAVVAAQPEHLAPLVDLLDSESLRERESASRRILRIPGLSLQDVEQSLESPGLSPEQSLRLSRVAESLFAASPRAGLGVRFSLQRENTVSLAGVVEIGDFPAAKILQAGDTFLAVDGHTQLSQAWLQSWIISHAPGESLNIKILRNGEELEFDIPLGSFDELGNRSPLDQNSIARAYKLRLSRLNPIADLKPALGESLTAQQWIDSAYPGAIYQANPRPVAVLSGQLVAGQSESFNRGMGWTTRSLHLLHPLSLTGNGFPEVLPDDLKQDLVAALKRQQESEQRRTDQLTQDMKQRQLTPEQRENYLQQISSSAARTKVIGEQLAQLETIQPSPQN